MRLGLLVCGLLILIYLMDFLYFQRGLESRPSDHAVRYCILGARV